MALGFFRLALLVLQCFWVEIADFIEEREQRRLRLLNSCFRTLPLELVAHVIDEVADDESDYKDATLYRQRTLAACARTSRRLSKFAYPQLWERPYLTGNIDRFERTLLNRPRASHAIRQIVIDLRSHLQPLEQSGPAARVIEMLTGKEITTLGLMSVQDIGLYELACIPRLEKLHLHYMAGPSRRNRSPDPWAHMPFPAFTHLTSLSLSAIHLPQPAGESSPTSELFLPEMLPNLDALEIDECCVRIVQKTNLFSRLRYLALRCSCTRCVPLLDLDNSLESPLELFELNSHPFFLEYFQHFGHHIPSFKRLRIASEYLRWKPNQMAFSILQLLVEALRDRSASYLRHATHLHLPHYWMEEDGIEVEKLRQELVNLAHRARISVTWDVVDEGSRINRATLAASFASSFWHYVDQLKAERRAMYD
ncbi:uncharacterized protein JCM15063_001546 [Sporobolomyces koalae]|uniref:uncharacterized protein n=1 Tax=Sporobolomyces koalae TaxID=500713 RepID=UPI003179EC13